MLIELLAKRAVVKSRLYYRFKDCRKNKWYLKNEAVVCAVNSFNAIYQEIQNRPAEMADCVLKSGNRRLVFKFRPEGQGGDEFVAKCFLLDNLRHRIKSYRYGLDEAANLLIATQRGISVPKIYGFGIQYGELMLPKANYLLLECLSDYVPIGVLFEESKCDIGKCQEILMRTIPAFVSLYQSGCNHIDIHTETIMMSRDCERPPKILDFHYARFYDKPSLEVLAFEAGGFAGHCSDWLNEKMISEWFCKLMGTIDVEHGPTKNRLKDRFAYYLKAALSRKERMNIH